MFNRSSVKTDWALSKVEDLLGHPNPGGDFGIELELEADGLKKVGNELLSNSITFPWTVHIDGSLNHKGREFVLKKPLSASLCYEAIEELYYLFNKNNIKFEDSKRCSTHVHMNFLDRTVNQVMLFFVLHYTIEEALYKAIAPSRFHNQFCLPAVLSEPIIDELVKAQMNQRLIEQDFGAKYRALNIKSLFKYGSLENRMKGGSYTAGDVIKWLKVLQELYEFVKKHERLTPDVFMAQFSGKGFQIFLQEFLPITWELIKDVPDLDRVLDRGVFIAQDVAYVLDWTGVVDATAPKHVRTVKPPKHILQAHAFNQVYITDYGMLDVAS